MIITVAYSVQIYLVESLARSTAHIFSIKLALASPTTESLDDHLFAWVGGSRGPPPTQANKFHSLSWWLVHYDNRHEREF